MGCAWNRSKLGLVPILTSRPPPVSSLRQFLAGFPTPDPAEIQIREPTGAFSSVNLWFCADLLHRVPRILLFDPLPSHVTRPAAAGSPTEIGDDEPHTWEQLAPVPLDRTVGAMYLAGEDCVVQGDLVILVGIKHGEKAAMQSRRSDVS